MDLVDLCEMLLFYKEMVVVEDGSGDYYVCYFCIVEMVLEMLYCFFVVLNYIVF